MVETHERPDLVAIRLLLVIAISVTMSLGLWWAVTRDRHPEHPEVWRSICDMFEHEVRYHGADWIDAPGCQIAPR